MLWRQSVRPDKPETGVRETALWFETEELVDWKRDVDRWVFEK